MEAVTITARAPLDAIRALVAADGTAGADHANALRDPCAAMRDLSDAVHALCQLHGTMPGIVDHAQAAGTDAAERMWLDLAVDAIAGERAHIARVVAAVGPQPSTPGQAVSEAAVGAQRHALEMLARSDRDGCALGTAVAFVLDWAAVRRVIDAAVMRVGAPAAPRYSPVVDATLTFLGGLAPTAARQRAMTFGAQQMLAQQRGLWHLLEARASARTVR